MLSALDRGGRALPMNWKFGVGRTRMVCNNECKQYCHDRGKRRKKPEGGWVENGFSARASQPMGCGDTGRWRITRARNRCVP